MNPKKKAVEAAAPNGAYQSLVGGVASVIEDARRTAARSVNAAMTAAYWLIGRHILEFEQGGRDRGEYGGKVVERLAADLSRRYGRGFSFRNLWQMRAFYIAWPVLHPERAIPEAAGRKLQTVFAELSSRGETADRSAELGQAQKLQTASGKMHLYLNYARDHWANEHENPPVGLILCAQKGESLARYALEGLPNKVMAAEYRTALPDEALLAAEVERARGELDLRRRPI